ncbi:MAG TPA: ATPase domain-containing protein [Thermoplasmata archaeon]|nr:ATPase domain-containing protein [Thermoplasmata archaeon]
MSDPLDGTILGLPELDRDLAPALPKGWLGLLNAPTDAEASLLAKQFAARATPAAPAVFYTTYERTEDVQSTFRGLGWDPTPLRIVNLAEEYFVHVLSPRLEVSRIRERGLVLADLASGTLPGEARAPFNLTNRILSDIAGLDRPFRLVLDSLDFLLEVLDLPEVLTIARQTRHRAQALGAQALLVVHSEIHERRASGLLEEMADLVLELDAQPDGTRYEHRLALRKVRNHPELKRTAIVRITPNGFALAGPGRP